MRVLKTVVIMASIAAAVWLVFRPVEPTAAVATVTGLTPATEDLSGFERALSPLNFVFPLDHGPHDSFQTEWWYYTGNLADAQGRRFGYQLTFFRRALLPEEQMPARTSNLASGQVYFAHFAVTDAAADSHEYAERFSRGAGGLAGASGDPYRVFLEDWSAIALDDTGDHVRLTARQGSIAIALELRSAKPIVAHGDGGLSAKSDAAGNASYYYSFTRLETRGTINTASGTFGVAGSSWMDHEWSTSALGPNAQGWDWYSLQLDNQREIMMFQVRNSDGSLDAVSGGTLVNADGSTQSFTRDQVQVEVLERWRSPDNGAEYPIRWRVRLPDYDLDLEVVSIVKDQQVRVSVEYWEGAVSIRGTDAGAPISGVGYIELTGYSGSLNGKF